MIYGLNLYAIIIAALSTLVLGAIWYSPKVFGNAWCRAEGKEIQETNKKGHKPWIFVIFFLLSLIAAFMFRLFLGPYPSLFVSLAAGLVIGLCWITTSFAINYMFASRSMKLLLIDGGFHTLQFVLYGLIIGLWS